MSLRRTSTVIAGILVLASTLTVAGTAGAAPSPRTISPNQPTIAVPAAAPNWTPPRNYAPPSGSFFAFPNRSGAERLAIRNRVLFTTQSVWGGPRDRNGLPISGGQIRMATWSFSDWDIAKALVAAHRRGASVQISAASTANQDHGAWKWLKGQLGQRYYKTGIAGSAEKVSFARECRGSCRGSGGTTHAKYFMFDNVGASHKRKIVMQTSMNLTSFGYTGQWNQAQIIYSPYVYDHFMRVFREVRIGRPVSASYRRYSVGSVTSLFFPFRSANASSDPVMQALNQTRCTGANTGGNGRTRIRVIQYAIYDNRGVWIAKKLRSLWNAGCDVRIIYSLTTRPVLSILRNKSGRGAIPMKQSVIKNRKGEIVKYNHSKWMTIAGNWGSSRATWLTFSGSANWSNIPFYSDEQMQQIQGYGTAHAHMVNFDATWRQGSSHPPQASGGGGEGRFLPEKIPFGQGEYKYLNPYGD
jgi:phosphatidylserine/phosphatidylglycerophosphate/cardiolipin synthase-like enzyme